MGFTAEELALSWVEEPLLTEKELLDYFSSLSKKSGFFFKLSWPNKIVLGELVR